VDEPDANRLVQTLAPTGKPELWLFAAPQSPGGRDAVRFLPLTILPREKISAMLSASKAATVGFDADYLSWEEALAGCEHSR
jgi:hypothetical protein